MFQHVRLACLALALCACAQRAGPAGLARAPAKSGEAGARRDTPHQRAEPPSARRSLAADATYADLVRLASQLDGQPADNDQCLLTRTPDALRLTGAVDGALRPLPLPGAELDVVLERSATVNVLSLFGRHGDAAGALTLAAFSAAPPTREAAALVVTDRGLYVRGANASLPMANRQPLPATLAALDALPDAAVFVAAEAGVPLRELAQLLAALGERKRSVALAVNLAPNTVLPEARPSQGDALCPGGLPETGADQGELSVAELQAGLSNLRARAADCVNQADARGAAGGKLKLALRITAAGSVETACVVTDETGDARLRACVLAETRKLGFVPPHPSGSVDVELPLLLRAQTFAAPALVCLQ
jgi:hypothetical protein